MQGRLAGMVVGLLAACGAARGPGVGADLPSPSRGGARARLRSVTLVSHGLETGQSFTVDREGCVEAAGWGQVALVTTHRIRPCVTLGTTAAFFDAVARSLEGRATIGEDGRRASEPMQDVVVRLEDGAVLRPREAEDVYAVMRELEEARDALARELDDVGGDFRARRATLRVDWRDPGQSAAGIAVPRLTFALDARGRWSCASLVDDAPHGSLASLVYDELRGSASPGFAAELLDAVREAGPGDAPLDDLGWTARVSLDDPDGGYLVRDDPALAGRIAARARDVVGPALDGR